jgi:hypothetical protein
VGYDLHITRKSEWFDEEGAEISLDEWKTYLCDDNEFIDEGFAEAVTPDGAVVRLESDGLAVWRAYSGHESEGNKAWFLFSKGNVIVKNPDEEIRRKMHEVAVSLMARVQGDEGEFYGPDGEQLPASVASVPRDSSSRPWWKFWR